MSALELPWPAGPVELAAPPVAAARPCVVVNPRSFRAARGLAAKAVALAEQHGAQVLQVEGMASLSAGIAQVLARRQGVVMVLAGDGTVHAVVEQLALQAQGAWLPDLVVLPGGRSNMTAKDLSPQGDALSLLQRALVKCRDQGWTAASVAERDALRIEQAGSPPRYGFFVGAALVDSVIRATHQHRARGSGALRTGHASSLWSVARLGLLALVGRSGLACPQLSVAAQTAAGTEQLQGAVRVLLATTLQHETGLFDPYADRGTGPLRLTAVSCNAPRFWRALPRILSGRFLPWMNHEQGYLSGRFERISVTGVAGYALDGEEYDTDPALPLTLSAGPRLRFLLP